MKKALLTVLGVLILVCILTFTAFAENTSGVLDSGECGADGDNVTWTLYKDGELVISGEGEMMNFGFHCAPWYESYSDDIKKVVVEKGVTSIGDNAFTNFYYTTVFKIAESVASIGQYSFGWTAFDHVLSTTTDFDEIKLPESVTFIENRAFYGSHIKQMVIPEKITIIKNSTFSNCIELDSVVIPSGITIIEDNAFANCSEIDTVYFRGTEEQWNNITFGTGNGYLKSAENIVFNAVCHDYEENVVAPTCMEKGYTEYICKICDESYIDADSYTDLVEHQTTNGNCNVCGMFVVEEYAEISLSISLSTDSRVVWSLSNNNAEIVSTGFSKVAWGSYVNVTASATIKGLTEGKTTLIATVNGNVVSTAEIEVIKHEHSYYTTVVSPTCTEKGFTKYVCGCGDSYTDTLVDATGHTEVKLEGKSATCTESGLTEGKKCSVCNEILVEQTEVPATGHTEVNLEGKSATCTESGLAEGKKCSVCDEILVAQTEIPATGHTEVKLEGKSATCTETGHTEGKKCSVCDEILVAQIEIPATGHTEVKLEGKSATCTETGLTEGKKCSVCEEILVAQKEISATGHVLSEWIVKTPAKVGVKGLEEQKCTVCNTVVNKRDIPALAEVVTNKVGDVNGDGEITASDARIALRISAGLETLESANAVLDVIDINKDGEITASDARTILRKSAGLE